MSYQNHRSPGMSAQVPNMQEGASSIRASFIQGSTHGQAFQQRPLQPVSAHESQEIIMPIRQPIQPGYPPSPAGGTLQTTPATFPPDGYYWPMNSINGVQGTLLEGMCAAQPAAVHLGHSQGRCCSRPMLVSEGACGTRVLEVKKPAVGDERDAATKVSLGFSPEYHGDPFLARNQSADIPDSLNCSLFLVNLPPKLTTHRLIAAIHAMGPTGRIYATHINSPEPARRHYGCAAKVIFFELAAARAFHRACGERGFVVDGYSARVMWNRIRTAEQGHARSTTRVLLIGGRPDLVNPTSLTEYFCTKLQFQVDCIITHSDGRAGDKRDAVVEYRFGSFRCQAEAARMALVREHPDVRCFFHSDPCDPEHWAPSTPVPVVQSQGQSQGQSQNPVPSRPLPSPPGPRWPSAGPARGFQTWAGLPVVRDPALSDPWARQPDEHDFFRPMRASLGPGRH